MSSTHHTIKQSKVAQIPASFNTTLTKEEFDKALGSMFLAPLLITTPEKCAKHRRIR